jgi:hypothetical protein
MIVELQIDESSIGESRKMNILEQLERTISYVAEATLELFSPNHDSYPLTGVQPFEGDPYEGKSKWYE